ncbi:MAG: hypothetical protein GX119_06080 [Syntrophomonadaceae bacterium]|jgi:hypothetical protein|nr:hypothetical protein [Syntrophomonadaceae bacterium]
MIATNAVFRYYIYLADDHHKLEPWLNSFKSQGFQIQAGIGRPNENPDGPDKFMKELEQDNSKVLVLQCWGAEMILSDALAQMDSTHLNPDLLLGQVTVLASNQLAWPDIISLIPLPASATKPYAISMTVGQMSRFKASAHHVYYACQPQDFDHPTMRLLSQRLPQLEASHLTLGMITRLLRERNRMVEQELREMDQQLSRIMHAHLVKEQKELKEAEELEQQIQTLSSAYGMLATDINLINEGRRRLQREWERFTLKLSQERTFKISDHQLESLGQPFLDTLNILHELYQSLITTRDSHQAAIDVVHSRIDIMNSRTNMATQENIRELMELNTDIQKQGLAFQLAAGLIEFIVLAYYSHSLWKNLVPIAYNSIPAALQLVAVLLFSGLTTYLTHLLAEYVQGRTYLKIRIISTSIPLFLLLMIILLASIIFNGLGFH